MLKHADSKKNRQGDSEYDSDLFGKRLFHKLLPVLTNNLSNIYWICNYLFYNPLPLARASASLRRWAFNPDLRTAPQARNGEIAKDIAVSTRKWRRSLSAETSAGLSGQFRPGLQKTPVIIFRDYALDPKIGDNPSPPAPLPQGERGPDPKPMNSFAPWRLCVRIRVKYVISSYFAVIGKSQASRHTGPRHVPNHRWRNITTSAVTRKS